MRLVNGSHVVIVGGGPSGSFTALHLLNFAAAADLKLDVTILEGRDFSQLGPGGCNKCAGILSANLLRNLASLDLHIPPHVIQSEIFTYNLHINDAILPVHQPDPNHRILSVYRGSGPRLGSAPPVHSFDSWLLEQARRAGADVQHERVQVVRQAGRPIVVTRRQEIHADLVILATGINARFPLDPSWGYQPPLMETMAQDEVPLPGDFLKDSVDVFFDNPPGLIFGALIPKGHYANISLLGHQMPPNAVKAFLEGNDLVHIWSGEVPRLCGCSPRVSVSMASNFFADRMAVVGEAAVTRLYKDGISAAFTTARAAARTAVQMGIARSDFAAGYLPVCRRIDQDNRYGRLLFRMWSINCRSPFLLQAWQRAIEIETALPSDAHIHTRLLWNMFTGSETYRRLFWLLISWRALARLVKGAWLNWRNR